jgi:hypothetical protein
MSFDRVTRAGLQRVGKRVRLATLVNLDRLPSGVKDDPAVGTAGNVLFEFLPDGGLKVAVKIAGDFS